MLKNVLSEEQQKWYHITEFIASDPACPDRQACLGISRNKLGILQVKMLN